MRRVHSTWLSYKDMRIYCIDFSGLGSDLDGLQVEMQACQAQLSHQTELPLLATVDLHQTEFGSEIAAFFARAAVQPVAPFRKLAILGLSVWGRFWVARTKGVQWPTCARFFDGYDSAKDWLVTEGF
jgi:hypothetical protein